MEERSPYSRSTSLAPAPGSAPRRVQVPSRASTPLFTHSHRTPPGDRLKLPRGRQPHGGQSAVRCPLSPPITCLLPPASCARAAPPAENTERTRPSADDAATALRSRRRSPIDSLRCLVEADAAARSKPRRYLCPVVASHRSLAARAGGSAAVGLHDGTRPLARWDLRRVHRAPSWRLGRQLFAPNADRSDCSGASST